MIMKVYRIKHIPTGLYYRPSVGVGKRKTNLGLKGKLYQSNPSYLDVLQKDGSYIVNVSETQIKKYPYLQKANYDYNTYGLLAKDEKWEIEEL